MKQRISDTDPKKGSYKDRNGTTRVGDFLRTIGGVAPELLDIAGKISGVKGLELLADKIKGTTSMSEFEKELALKELEYDMIEAKEISNRWASDMTSDSWLSKNVRPMVLLFLTLSMTVLIIVDSSSEGFIVKTEWINLLSSLLLLVYGAYFGGRSVEKIMKIRNK